MSRGIEFDLAARGIVQHNNDVGCVFCSAQESCQHLFFLCQFALQIWICVCRWFGTSACMVEGLNRMFKGKNGKKVKPLIWLTTI
jgi:hypothetical protein